MDVIVDAGAIEALVPHLSAPGSCRPSDGPVACEHEVEKDAAFTLGLLAVKVFLEEVKTTQLSVTSCSAGSILCRQAVCLSLEHSQTGFNVFVLLPH